MSQKPITKTCYLCAGYGYSTNCKPRTRYNTYTKRSETEWIWEKDKCTRCNGSGKVIDEKAEKQRLQKLRVQAEKKRQQEEKQKKYQDYKMKEQKFAQFARQYEIQKPLLQDDSSFLSDSVIERSSILSTQRSKGMAYCGICGGTGYQKNYMSKQRTICSNCDGSGKVMLNQGQIPRVVVGPKRQQLKRQSLMNKKQNGVIFCGNCGGKGYEKIYMSDQTRKCQNCNGIGKLYQNPDDIPQKTQEEIMHDLQEKRKQQKKKKRKQNKEKQSLKIKSEAELRAEFQKQYTEQQQRLRTEREQRQYRARREREVAKRQADQKARLQKLERDRKFEEFKKTPEGILYMRRLQNQMKWQDRKQSCCDCLECIVKIICCGGPSCGRVLIWIGALFLIGLWTFLWIL